MLSIETARELIYKEENEALFNLYKVLHRVCKLELPYDEALYHMVKGHLLLNLNDWVLDLPNLNYDSCKTVNRYLGGTARELVKSIILNESNDVYEARSEEGLSLSVKNPSVLPVGDYDTLSVWFGYGPGTRKVLRLLGKGVPFIIVGDSGLGGDIDKFKILDAKGIVSRDLPEGTDFHAIVETIFDVTGYIE